MTHPTYPLYRRRVRQILDTAAEILTDHGWTVGAYQRTPDNSPADEPAGVCVAGALNLAVGAPAEPTGYGPAVDRVGYEDFTLLLAAKRALLTSLPTPDGQEQVLPEEGAYRAAWRTGQGEATEPDFFIRAPVGTTYLDPWLVVWNDRTAEHAAQVLAALLAVDDTHIDAALDVELDDGFLPAPNDTHDPATTPVPHNSGTHR